MQNSFFFRMSSTGVRPRQRPNDPPASIRAAEAAMFQRRQLPAHGGKALSIEISHHHRRTVLMPAGEYFTPGIDDHRMPPGLTATGMTPALRGRHDVALVLDCPCA